MKKNNGFTMIELLGVVILIVAITLLVFPTLIEQFNKSKNEISESTLKLIYSSTDEYVNQDLDSFPRKNGTVRCVPLRSVVDSGLLSDSLTDVINDKKYDLDQNVVKVLFKNDKFQYELVQDGSCVPKTIAESFASIMSLSDEVYSPSIEFLIDMEQQEVGSISEDAVEYINKFSSELRYGGGDPNNYVDFNGELWRIIGVIDGQAKIVRDEPYGGTSVSWDNDSAHGVNGLNDWSQSSLQKELNGTFLDSMDDVSKSFIDTTHVWGAGGVSTSDIETYGILFYHSIENGTPFSGDTGEIEDDAVTWTGAIGVVGLSDVAMSIDIDNYVSLMSLEYTLMGITDSLCQLEMGMPCADYFRMMLFSGSINSIMESQEDQETIEMGVLAWLYDKGIFSWSMTSVNDTTDKVLTYGFGAVQGMSANINSSLVDNPDLKISVLPTLYLKSNVGIVDGAGSKNDPYVLQLMEE